MAEVEEVNREVERAGEACKAKEGSISGSSLVEVGIGVCRVLAGGRRLAGRLVLALRRVAPRSGEQI